MAAMEKPELIHLDGPETLKRLEQIQQVYATAFPSYDLDDYRWRTSRQAESPGFGTVIAQTADVLAGFIYGLPLNEQTGWWNGLQPSPEDGFTTETGARTFAVIDLAVLPTHRGHGLGRQLIDELLKSRPEERATLATDPREKAVQAMYERWGWRKAGRAPGSARETVPEFDLYVRALREEGTASNSR